MTLKFLDLFGGAGGWALGLRMAGLHHVAHYDKDAAACRTAERNLGGLVKSVDLRTHRPEAPAEGLDLIVGSPPCQGFSNEGEKKADDARNDLVWSYLDIVESLQPRIWLFENVPGFRRLYGGRYYRALQKRLNSMEYHWNAYILDAADYGVPQHRERFFVIGAKDFRPEPPEPTHAEGTSLFSRKPYITLWEAISDLPSVGLGERTGVFAYSSPASNPYQEWTRSGSSMVFNHTTQRHSPRVLEKIRAVPAGQGMEVFVNRYEENQVTYCGGYRRALKDVPSYTAYWTRGMTSIHPVEDRFLSPRECARLQAFPDSFVFHGTTIQNYTQVCNAVPPLVARAFGRYLMKTILGMEVCPIPWVSEAKAVRSA